MGDQQKKKPRKKRKTQEVKYEFQAGLVFAPQKEKLEDLDAQLEVEIEKLRLSREAATYRASQGEGGNRHPNPYCEDERSSGDCRLQQHHRHLPRPNMRPVRVAISRTAPVGAK